MTNPLLQFLVAKAQPPQKPSGAPQALQSTPLAYGSPQGLGGPPAPQQKPWKGQAQPKSPAPPKPPTGGGGSKTPAQADPVTAMQQQQKQIQALTQALQALTEKHGEENPLKHLQPGRSPT